MIIKTIDKNTTILATPFKICTNNYNLCKCCSCCGHRWERSWPRVSGVTSDVILHYIGGTEDSCSQEDVPYLAVITPKETIIGETKVRDYLASH